MRKLNFSPQIDRKCITSISVWEEETIEGQREREREERKWGDGTVSCNPKVTFL